VNGGGGEHSEGGYYFVRELTLVGF